ncbi:MAG TPA: hypothetical protein VER96_37900 [Polyangiaceae bacterium]|nr:hypothetical protein [Polyangiaceae bacterium]
MAYLAELDERRLFLDLGYSSLFEYCVEKLKLCESTAGRHIAAARGCRTHPKAFALVASGTLHASALSLLKKYLTTENAAELFELCTHRSARQVETLLAERFPRPNVRDLVRRLPDQAQPTLNVGSSGHAQPTLNVGGSGHAQPTLNVGGSGHDFAKQRWSSVLTINNRSVLFLMARSLGLEFVAWAAFADGD